MKMRMEELFYQKPNVPEIDKKTAFVTMQSCTLNILCGILKQHEIRYDFSCFLMLFHATEIQVNSQTLSSKCDILILYSSYLALRQTSILIISLLERGLEYYKHVIQSGSPFLRDCGNKL